jgi:hypothetical protein
VLSRIQVRRTSGQLDSVSERALSRKLSCINWQSCFRVGAATVVDVDLNIESDRANKIFQETFKLCTFWPGADNSI